MEEKGGELKCCPSKEENQSQKEKEIPVLNSMLNYNQWVEGLVKLWVLERALMYLGNVT